MTRAKKKGTEGVAVTYIARSRAMRKLQLGGNDFRRLCILKGIYPRDTKHKNKIRGVASSKNTVYLVKDIQFLAHEPLLAKFRELKAFHKRIRRYMSRGEWSKVKSVEKTIKPHIQLDHLVRERYPTFVDALRDLDDPLSMIALFATMPRVVQGKVESGDIVMAEETSAQCARLLREFEAYVMATGALKKAFVSIKGIYYQAVVMGQTITWVVPHEFATEVPMDVDYKVMLTFLEFYTTLMRFVNFRLFARLSWPYPEAMVAAAAASGAEDVVVPLERMPPVKDIEGFFVDGDKRPLTGRSVFISREVPRKALSFVAQSLGASVSFTSEDGTVCGTVAEDDPSVAYQIVDRPVLAKMYVDRTYVQPQWFFDCLNAGGEALLPTEAYRIGAPLPPHMSPFVLSSEEEDIATDDEEEEEEERPLVEAGAAHQGDATSEPAAASSVKKSAAQEKKAAREMAVSMLSKKKKKLYDSMQRSREAKLKEKKTLEEKRRRALAKGE